MVWEVSASNIAIASFLSIIVYNYTIILIWFLILINIRPFFIDFSNEVKSEVKKEKTTTNPE